MRDSPLGPWPKSHQAPPFGASTPASSRLWVSAGLLRVLLTQDLPPVCQAPGSILFLPLAPSFPWRAPAPGRQKASEALAGEYNTHLKEQGTREVEPRDALCEVTDAANQKYSAVTKGKCFICSSH